MCERNNILSSFICSYNVEQNQTCDRSKGNKDECCATTFNSRIYDDNDKKKNEQRIREQEKKCIMALTICLVAL
jgi:hypothetical protein